MFIALVRRTAQSLMSSASLRVIILCASLTALLMVLWLGGVYITLGQTEITGTSWLETTLDVMLGAGAVASAYFLFPILLPLIASVFLDRFMERVAEKEYGKTLRAVPLHEELPKTLLFVGQALLLNLLLFPLYAIFFFIPPINLVLYYSVNGYLLAREFWMMVCNRMMIDARDKRQQRSQLYMSGVLLLICANIPPLTLITPIMAAAFMLHLGFMLLNRGEVVMRTGSHNALQPYSDIVEAAHE